MIRSGIEVYGAAGSPTRPDEARGWHRPASSAARSPISERTARDVADRIGVPVGKVRLGTVLGPHVPSPLGRLLRQPLVPFSLLADPPFAVVEDRLKRGRSSPPPADDSTARSTSSPTAITALQAARRARRVPVPLVGPEWVAARTISNLAGAPIPDHVLELMHRGRLASNRRMPAARLRRRHQHRQRRRQGLRLAVGDPPTGQAPGGMTP